MSRRIPVAALPAVVAALAVAAVLVAAGCGESTPKVVPDFRGQRLDVAESRLDRAGLDFEVSGGGTFGVVVSSHWWVCDQDPRPGKKSTDVTLIVDRSCEWTVPRVSLLTLRRADAILERVGVPHYVADIHGRRPLTPERWIVCEQVPAAGLTTSRVRLTVARSCRLSDVKGLVLTRALGVLGETNVRVEVATRAGDTPHVTSRWTVCKQEPRAGQPANTVALTVGRKCPTIVPDVQGYELDDAVADLEQLGLEYAIVTENGERPRVRSFWDVCDQAPEPGVAATFVRLYAARSCG